MNIGSFQKVGASQTEPNSFLVSSSFLKAGASVTEPNDFLGRLLSVTQENKAKRMNPPPFGGY